MTAQHASIIAALATLILGVLAFYKYKPGQKEVTDVNVAQAQIDVATGALKLVTTSLTAEIERLTKKVVDLSADVDQMATQVEYCNRVHGGMKAVH
jgi:uncharacterized protein YoxC